MKKKVGRMRGLASTLISASIGVAGLILPAVALAQQVCVECTEPAMTYSCSIQQSQRIQGFRQSDRVIRYACVKVLAQIGSHASCRASKLMAGTCAGQPVELTTSQLLSVPPPGDTAEQTDAAPAAQPAPAKSDSADGPPKTVQELAQKTFKGSKQSLDSAGETVKNAGQAVGGAMKKSWDCLTSFFNQC